MMTVKKFGAMLVMASILLTGCDKETKSTSTKEVKTPDGSTKVTTEVKTETSGSNPPVVR
ncbi:MAG: hypothetical protein K8U03_18745 [Planctomycetia bacterium]|nr:hypothetical protein [Planctomycetia bacterium]